MKKEIEVDFSCGHRGVIDVETKESMLKTEGSCPINEDMIQYVVYQNKVNCPTCERNNNVFLGL